MSSFPPASGRDEDAAAYPSGHTTNQWLIERGQPEGEQNAVWLEHTGIHPAIEGRWTRNAWDAAMFPDKATAESYIAERGLEARAVEHGFMFPRSGRDASAAVVDGAGSKTRSGHHETVGERQGRQPAPSTSSAASPSRQKRTRKPGERQRLAALLANVARGGCPCGGKFKWTGVQMRCDRCDAHEGWPMKESLRHLLRSAAAELKS